MHCEDHCGRPLRERWMRMLSGGQLLPILRWETICRVVQTRFDLVLVLVRRAEGGLYNTVYETAGRVSCDTHWVGTEM